MEYAEDPTPLLMDVAKDEKGREATEFGYEEQDEYRDHLIRISFDRNEQRVLDLLLLELMEEFGMYIGNDEMTTLENANVQKAIEISRKYATEECAGKETVDKFLIQLENAEKFHSDVYFG